MQFLILLLGVLVFVFYQFATPAMIFNAVETVKVEQTAEYQTLNSQYETAHARREQAALEYVRNKTEETRIGYVESNKLFNDARKNATDLLKLRAAIKVLTM